MKDANSRIGLLQEAIAIEKQRATLQAKLEPLEKRLAAISQQLRGTIGRPGPAPAKAGGSKAPSKRAGLSRRGELSAAIFSALEAAGSAGVRVQDMADRFGVKVRNLFVWFSTTGRKFKRIKKVGPGRYRLVG